MGVEVSRCPAPGLVARLVTVSATAAASAPATAAAVTTPATATAGALLALSSDVDVQGTAAQLLAVQAINGLLRLFGGAHGDEGKPARPAAGPVSDEVGFDDGTERREGILQVVLGDFEVEVPDE